MGRSGGSGELPGRGPSAKGLASLGIYRSAGSGAYLSVAAGSGVRLLAGKALSLREIKSQRAVSIVPLSHNLINSAGLSPPQNIMEGTLSQPGNR